MKAIRKTKEIDYFPFVGKIPNIDEFEDWLLEIGYKSDYIIRSIGGKENITSKKVFVLLGREEDDYYLDTKENFFNEYTTKI